LAEQEQDTVNWYAFSLGPSSVGIFDTFEHEEGRQAHLGGQIAKALMEKAPELLAETPIIKHAELLAIK
jgi:quinol monooxygenase YgiN